jgi:hypothetical protein
MSNNHICHSQSSSFTEAAYELGTSASEAFDTGNSSGLGDLLFMIVYFFFFKRLIKIFHQMYIGNFLKVKDLK